MLCGYAFMPVAFLLGADWQDCRVVGELFGTKTFLNEFIAYQKMQPLIENRLSDVSKFSDSGKINFISVRLNARLCDLCWEIFVMTFCFSGKVWSYRNSRTVWLLQHQLSWNYYRRPKYIIFLFLFYQLFQSIASRRLQWLPKS